LSSPEVPLTRTQSEEWHSFYVPFTWTLKGREQLTDLVENIEIMKDGRVLRQRI
jgi:hypothetical protein